MGWLNWIGNIFIVGGLWGVGNKNRNAFILSLVGESLWIASSAIVGNWALFTICLVFWGMALRGYIKWGR